ncbi:MAG: helix-turn-helix domain-containing protein [Thermoleophilaceae bacterium]
MTTAAATDVLRRKQTAERLGVHPNTLAGWVKKGWLTPVRYPGGEMRFRSDEVEELRRRIFDIED